MGSNDRGEKKSGGVPEEEDGHIQAGCGGQCEEEPHIGGVPGRLGVPRPQFIRNPASATHVFPEKKEKPPRLLGLIARKPEGEAIWA